MSVSAAWELEMRPNKRTETKRLFVMSKNVVRCIQSRLACNPQRIDEARAVLIYGKNEAALPCLIRHVCQ